MSHVDEVEGGVEESVEKIREAQTEDQEVCLVSYPHVLCGVIGNKITLIY